MQSYWSQLALVGVLVVINAVFAGSELALVSLRDSQVQRLERTGRAGRVLARLARDPNRFLATIQIGITLAGFLASAAAAVSLARPLVPLLEGVVGRAAEPMAIVLVTLALTFVTLVFGELAPKRIAMQIPERWALLVARPLDLLAAFTRPAVWALSATSDLVVRMVGLNPKPERDEISPDELRDIVAGNHGFTKEQQTIIAGAVEIADRKLRAVLVPRLQVFCLDSGTTAEAARLVLAASGHSRAPVVRHGGLDEAVGVIHLRDLVGVRDDQPVDEYARPPMLLPDSVPVVDALRQFKAERQHMALVVDERGAVDGIVTLEDILEEIVGEIYDETDRDVREVRTEPDGSLLLPGTFPMHDLPDIGVELPGRPEGDYTTVAGLVLAVLGRIPTIGEHTTVDGWRFEVTQVDDRAIAEIRLCRTAEAAASAEEDEDREKAADQDPAVDRDTVAGRDAVQRETAGGQDPAGQRRDGVGERREPAGPLDGTGPQRPATGDAVLDRGR
ncbi:hemolysin family protein [Micromonospora endophytica]|uniref:HlyC/CorC family transporter n=1 Tax=Micromonospora endophytica TaxID=515350 RepID=A0A2W2DK05_9ACTN|nr:hemolysin family protein [Micromonospora endophytica]PZF93163.1 HlyC/CorC family transporter [Micromonospora endophytica]RIW49937.1 HlyC/CorC family transporter [Micromonospora endophytica]BCJ57108.1 membrane protein [Micromonospora endophytica]